MAKFASDFLGCGDFRQKQPLKMKKDKKVANFASEKFQTLKSGKFRHFFFVSLAKFAKFFSPKSALF